MNRIEAAEIAKLPPQYRPLSAWAYFGYTILFSIPVIGLIMLIIMSFSKANINRRSFARSYFCFLLLMIILIILAVVLGMPGLEEFAQQYS